MGTSGIAPLAVTGGRLPVRASGVGTPRTGGPARACGVPGGVPEGWRGALVRLARECGAEPVAVVVADARAARLLAAGAGGAGAAWAGARAGAGGVAGAARAGAGGVAGTCRGVVALPFDAGVPGVLVVRPERGARPAALAARAGEVVAGAVEAAADAEAVRALHAAPRGGRAGAGLTRALRAAARELATPECPVEVRAAAGTRWDAAVEEAVLLVARAAVASAVRRARARVVTVTLTPSELVVRDDGAALPARPGGDAFRLRLAARPLAARGGGIEVSHGRRPGAVVRVRPGPGPGSTTAGAVFQRGTPHGANDKGSST